MPNFTLRDVPEPIISELDRLACQRNISRNQMIIEALQAYSLMQNENLHTLLPKLIESEVREEIKTFESAVSDSVNLILVCCLKLDKIADRLNDFLFPELEKLDENKFDSEQIISMMKSQK